MILPKEIRQQASLIKDEKLRQAFCEGAVAYAEYISDSVEVDITPPQFEEFWKLYDKKCDKAKCMTLWAKMSTKDKAACMEYIPMYKQAQPDKQYRKHPLTFLRNKSWNDELIFSNHAGNSSYTSSNGDDPVAANEQERKYLENAATNLFSGIR